MPPTSKRQRVQFKERTELLDFLLEVAAMTSETLDLDRLASRPSRITSSASFRTTSSPSSCITKGSMG